jgi:hypothetical protein
MSATARFRFCVLVSAAFAFAPLGAVHAQDPKADAAADEVVHTLEIHAGGLWLDGQPLPPTAVPDGLSLAGLEMAVQFSGPVTPVVEVDRIAYVFENQRLVRFEESSRAGDQVYFLGEPQPAPEVYDVQSSPAPPVDGRGGLQAARAVPPPAPRASAETGAAAPLGAADDEQLRQAGEAAYMMELSASDRALYDKIQREAALEAASLRLADQINRTTDPDERAGLRSQLRANLEAAFDLKQEIRSAEIERTEAQVAELRRMLTQRAARKSQIIEHRLRELVGQ